MAAIVLEPVNPQEPAEVEEVTEDPPAEPEAQEETAPEPVEEEQVLAPVEIAEPSAPELPAPKKRGRPPKAQAEPKAAPGLPKAKPAPKPKAKPRARKPPPPSSDSDSSSDVEETLKNVYNHALTTHSTTNMETAILEFLVNRKQSEATRRRELWSQLAKF